MLKTCGLKLGLIFAAVMMIVSTVSAAEPGKQENDTSIHSIPMPSNECNITVASGKNACVKSVPAVTATSQFPSNITTAACAALPGCYDGVRSDPGNAQIPIDVYQVCRYVDNSSSPAVSIFVPFRSSGEWADFRSYAPTTNKFITLVNCSVPYPTNATYLVPAPPYAQSNCAQGPTVTTPTTYARWYSSSNYSTWTGSKPTTVPFTTCNNGLTTINASVAVWNGLNADTYRTDSWQPVVSYSPGIQLQAQANILAGHEAGTTIEVASGTPVTLQWATNLTLTNYGAAPDSSPSPELTGSSSAAVSSTSSSLSAATWNSTSAANGTSTVTPVATTTYYIAIGGSNGVAPSTTSATVTVQQPISITSFTATPTHVLYGAPVQLSWTISNPSNAPVTCMAFGGWSGSVSSTGGTQIVNPTAYGAGGTGITTYVLQCKNAYQETPAASVAVINCDQGSTCTAAPPVTPPTSPPGPTGPTTPPTGPSGPSSPSTACNPAQSFNIANVQTACDGNGCPYAGPSSDAEYTPNATHACIDAGYTCELAFSGSTNDGCNGCYYGQWGGGDWSIFTHSSNLGKFLYLSCGGPTLASVGECHDRGNIYTNGQTWNATPYYGTNADTCENYFTVNTCNNGNISGQQFDAGPEYPWYVDDNGKPIPGCPDPELIYQYNCSQSNDCGPSGPG